MIKLLHFTDTHADDPYDFSKFQYVKDIANAEKVDGVLCGGDFLDDPDLNPIMQIKENRMRDLIQWIGDDGYLVGVGLQVLRSGGIEQLKNSKKPELMKLARTYSTYQSEIESAIEKYANRIKMNDMWTAAEIKEAQKDIDIDNRLRCYALDEILGKIKCPVYAVRGNHDFDHLVNFKWKNLKFLDDVADVKGLKIAAAPNWYETLGEAPESYYEKMEKDMSYDGNSGNLSREYNDLVEDLKRKYPEEIVKKIILTQILPGLSAYKRLNGKQFDVLLTHKGPHELATQKIEDKMVNFGSGVGLETIIHQARPKTIFAGHVHVPLVVNQRVSDDYSYHGLRGSPEEFFVGYFDEKTKSLAEFQRHRWSDMKKKAA